MLQKLCESRHKVISIKNIFFKLISKLTLDIYFNQHCRNMLKYNEVAVMQTLNIVALTSFFNWQIDIAKEIDFEAI